MAAHCAGLAFYASAVPSDTSGSIAVNGIALTMEVVMEDIASFLVIFASVYLLLSAIVTICGIPVFPYTILV